MKHVAWYTLVPGQVSHYGVLAALFICWWPFQVSHLPPSPCCDAQVTETSPCKGLPRIPVETTPSLLLPGTNTHKVIRPLLLFISRVLCNGMWEAEGTSVNLSWPAPPCPLLACSCLPCLWAPWSCSLGFEQLLDLSRVHSLSTPL